MKKFRILFALLVASCVALTAVAVPPPVTHSVTLEWDQNPELDLEGYVLAYHLGGAGWTTQEPPVEPAVSLTVSYPTTQGTFTGLTEGTTYYFAVKARNIYGLESLWSDVVTYTVPHSAPVKPARLRITIVQ